MWEIKVIYELSALPGKVQIYSQVVKPCDKHILLEVLDEMIKNGSLTHLYNLSMIRRPDNEA